MDATNIVYFILGQLLAIIPKLLVLLFGIILCITKWSKSPKASKIALIGIIIMLILSLLGIATSYLQSQMFLWFRDSYQTIGYVNFGIGFVFNFLWSVSLGLIIYAVWIERES
jgi:hypothetical protein